MLAPSSRAHSFLHLSNYLFVHRKCVIFRGSSTLIQTLLVFSQVSPKFCISCTDTYLDIYRSRRYIQHTCISCSCCFFLACCCIIMALSWLPLSSSTKYLSSVLSLFCPTPLRIQYLLIQYLLFVRTQWFTVWICCPRAGDGVLTVGPQFARKLRICVDLGTGYSG